MIINKEFQEFANKILIAYSDKTKTNLRSIEDISILEEYLLIRLFEESEISKRLLYNGNSFNKTSDAA